MGVQFSTGRILSALHLCLRPCYSLKVLVPTTTAPSCIFCSMLILGFRAGLQVRDEDGARMVALLDRDASDDIDFDEFRKFVCLLPQSQVCHAVHCVAEIWLAS